MDSEDESPSIKPPDMSLRELQDQVDSWITTVGVRYFSELTNLAVLVEEVGELSRILARTYGDQSFKKSDAAYSLPDEMADGGGTDYNIPDDRRFTPAVIVFISPVL